MEIYTVAFSTFASSQKNTLRLYSFYTFDDALAFYEIKRDQLETDCFDIVKHWHSLEENFLTFEEMYEHKYIDFNENNTEGDVFLRRMVFYVRGTYYYLNILYHNIMQFNN